MARPADESPLERTNAPAAAPDGPDDAPRAGSEDDVPIAPDLPLLPVVGITRRRLAFLAAGFVTVWIVILFARQVGEASAATARADGIREANEALALEIGALESELELIQTRPYIEQQARAYGLGSAGEIPFSLRPGAPPLPANAPGSASARLGGSEPVRTPLESWLSLLFGPER